MDDNIVKYIKTGMVNSKCIIVYFKDIADDEYIYITDAILYDESGSNILDSLSKQYNNNTFLSTPVVKNRNWHSISYDVEISNNFIFYIRVKVGHLGNSQEYKFKYDGQDWNEIPKENAEKLLKQRRLPE